LRGCPGRVLGPARGWSFSPSHRQKLAASRQDAWRRAPDAYRVLDGRSKPQDELRVAAVAELRADIRAQPGDLGGLAVYCSSHAAHRGCEQNALKRLARAHPGGGLSTGVVRMQTTPVNRAREMRVEYGKPQPRPRAKSRAGKLGLVSSACAG
jgi:hypothetical protein